MGSLKNTIKENKLLLIALILILLGLVFGVTYAVFNYNFKGNINAIETTGIKLEFLESNDELIAKENALPEKDEEGMAEDPFVFQVKSITSKTTDVDYIFYLI